MPTLSPGSRFGYKIEPMKATRLNHGLACALALVVMACCPAVRPDALPPGAYPGTLRAPVDLGADVMWRQRVTAKWGKSQSRSFEAVLQTQGGKLTLLGLSPMGQAGFVITLDKGAIGFDNTSGMDLPFPARFIVLDVQRAFWPWLGSAPPKAGERSGVVAGEAINETWRGGRLQRRIFRRIDGEPPGPITVSYEGYERGVMAPARVVLHNSWFDYVLVVETYEQQQL